MSEENEEYIQLKQKDIKPLREKLLKEQNYICPICKEEITLSESTLDHQHRLFKDEEIGNNGAGLCRGVICFRCNAWEGKIFNAHRRLGLHKKELDQASLMRNLAEYLEQENYPYIHPSEAEKPKKLGKRIYNKLKKVYSEKYPNRKELEYPKSGKITKEIQKLLDEFDLN